MLSDQFRKDYRQMTAQGVEFTPEDIVRLNALAVRIRLSQHAANTVHLPRVAFLGDLALREPTIAHEMWLEAASQWVKPTDNRTFDLLHGYALSHLDPEKLPDAFDARKVVKEVFGFAAKRLVRFTREQLSAAVDYALVGADWTAGETITELPNDGITELPNDNSQIQKFGNSVTSPSSPTLGLLCEARALRLPITLEDAKRMTASELDETIRRTLVKEGRLDFSAEQTRAFRAYRAAREEIRARSKRTNEKIEQAEHAEDEGKGNGQ